MFDAKALAEEAGGRLTEYRRHFHKNPELSFQEVHTSRFIRERLTEAGIELMPGIRGNSVVGVLKGGRPGKKIAFRAYIDALNLC